MSVPISRRRMIAAAPLALAGCDKAAAYFGTTAPPAGQNLSYALGPEPESLDPARLGGGFEQYILPALFEGLTNFHPYTLEPMAALATHCETSPDGMRLTFYLRGHPSPRGRRFPNTSSLTEQYRNGQIAENLSHGLAAPADHVPARWSDGRIITAHDFVYSWRRVLTPETAAPFAYQLYSIEHAKDVHRGKLSPERLGVRAIDEFTFQVGLEVPEQFFVSLTGNPVLAAVPRQAIESSRRAGREDDWTAPEKIVTSGAFALREWRPYDHVRLVKNQRYYEAGLVELQEIKFLSLQESMSVVNLYKTGDAHAMPGERLPFEFLPVLERKRDFHVAPAAFGVWCSFNTQKFPMNNVLLRYALNMAVDKEQLARFFGAERKPARSLVPPMPGYPSLTSLPVIVNGRSYDVLRYDPEGARALLAAAGFPNGTGADGRKLTVEYLSASLPLSRIFCQILQQQFRQCLGIELSIVVQEFKVAMQTTYDHEYKGLADGGDWGTYLDPNYFLSLYVTGSGKNDAGWTDDTYEAMLAGANRTLDAGARMRKLAECEYRLMKAMPVLPLFYNTWTYLQKPFVRGLGENALDLHPFKYVWIDTQWRQPV